MNRALKQVALVLGLIGTAALLLTATAAQGTSAGKATAGLVIFALTALDLLAIVLPPSAVRNVLMYLATALQLIISLVLASAVVLVGTIDPVNGGFVSSLPYGYILVSSPILLGMGAVALAIVAIIVVGLGLAISRHDMHLLRDAVAMSIIGLELILPVVSIVVLFILDQIIAGSQDPSVRDAAAIAGGVLIALFGIGALALLAITAARAEKRDTLVVFAGILLVLTIVLAIATTGLLFYVGLVAAIVGWLLILGVRGREMSFGWIGMLIVLGASGLLTFLTATTAGNPAIIVLPLALITIVSAGSSSPILSRGAVAGLTGISTVVIVFAGTLNGGSGNGVTDPKTAAASLAMFIVAAAFAALGWLIAIFEAGRIQAWGWLIASVLLLSIGALLFGLFGPTAEDVRQTRRQNAQRREAGVA